MNPNNDTPSGHLRHEAAQLEKMRQQIMSDMEALRTQEQNLRSYEARLRQMPAAHVAPAPVAGAREIDAEREKLSRLRGLLEAERRSLVDERLAVREEREALAHKAGELKQREAWLEVRERDFQARSFAAPPPKAAGASPLGFRLGLNEVPFAEYFRSQRRSA
ncbi:MAG: hypothetical protein C0502_05635 [Opitutus sp.]|nr:hypothetical protein [Opitutus sp.]